MYLACRQHILEILLECVFSNYFGSSSGPDIILFQRFKTEWANINQEKFQNNYFEVDLQTKQEVTSFCLSKLEEMHARDDYKEFLQLALITMEPCPVHQKMKSLTTSLPPEQHIEQGGWLKPFIH